MVQEYNLSAAPEQRLTEEQVELLYRLVLEFNNELAILGYNVQDYAIILGLRSSKQLGGLFADRQLTYSSQALAAVRKANMSIEPNSVSPLAVEQPEEEMEPPAAQPVVVDEPVEESRSLWTKYLTSSKTLSRKRHFNCENETTSSELGALSFGLQ